jgi:hypothetical protein
VLQLELFSDAKFLFPLKLKHLKALKGLLLHARDLAIIETGLFIKGKSSV